ncbi:MAG: hypothetical protein AB7L09_01205 [Nitrospira sp.]
MTSKRGCFYAGCKTSPSWGVESAAPAAKNPDGTPISILACDDHEQVLTADMRRAGTRYSLFPVIGPPITSGQEQQDRQAEDTEDYDVSYEEALDSLPWHVRALVNIVSVLIGPPMLIYYGIKWIAGFRPGRIK